VIKGKENKMLSTDILAKPWFIERQNVALIILMVFFTTKDPDKEKGLGLAVSCGIIRDHGETIRAE
jgi:hypothetical protein